MALPTRRAVWLMWLGLGLWTCGCAGGWPARPGKVEAPPRAQESAGGPPPTPSPALYIPPAPRPTLQRIEYQTLEVPVPVNQAKPAAQQPAAQQPAAQQPATKRATTPASEPAGQQLPPLIVMGPAREATSEEAREPSERKEASQPKES